MWTTCSGVVCGWRWRERRLGEARRQGVRDAVVVLLFPVVDVLVICNVGPFARPEDCGDG